MTATNMCSNFGSKWYSPPFRNYEYKVNKEEWCSLTMNIKLIKEEWCSLTMNIKLIKEEWCSLTMNIKLIKEVCVA